MDETDQKNAGAFSFPSGFRRLSVYALQTGFQHLVLKPLCPAIKHYFSEVSSPSYSDQDYLQDLSPRDNLPIDCSNKRYLVDVFGSCTTVYGNKPEGWYEFGWGQIGVFISGFQLLRPGSSLPDTPDPGGSLRALGTSREETSGKRQRISLMKDEIKSPALTTPLHPAGPEPALGLGRHRLPSAPAPPPPGESVERPERSSAA
ncbi:uncharacterized protein LOC129204654 [Grus americana]|uniref:uncharacterized protein LOC129204654 n=1 Tax=Grus americana TaxID=9117 RepID=UPI002407C4DA|nr:uncharacterized protein LOC129204654 [Grus americana]